MVHYSQDIFFRAKVSLIGLQQILDFSTYARMREELSLAMISHVSIVPLQISTSSSEQNHEKNRTGFAAKNCPLV